MKTFNGETISKKRIQEVLRTLDRTAIFRLTKTIYGDAERLHVYDLVRIYGPTQNIRSLAYDIAYYNARRHDLETSDKRHLEYIKANKYHIAMNVFMYHVKDPNSLYAKRPFMGQTHLYFASPIYGLSDYNKCLYMPIAGNERFCETICKLADKYFPTNNNK